MQHMAFVVYNTFLGQCILYVREVQLRQKLQSKVRPVGQINPNDFSQRAKSILSCNISLRKVRVNQVM